MKKNNVKKYYLTNKLFWLIAGNLSSDLINYIDKHHILRFMKKINLHHNSVPSINRSGEVTHRAVREFLFYYTLFSFMTIRIISCAAVQFNCNAIINNRQKRIYIYLSCVYAPMKDRIVISLSLYASRQMLFHRILL